MNEIKQAKLNINVSNSESNNQITDIAFPIHDATSGANIIDVRTFYSNTGMFLYDPGFESTASCRSSITYIDGGKGVLKYRGIDIAEISEKYDFIDVAHLLFYDIVPKKIEKQTIKEKIKTHSFLDKEIKNIIYSLPKNTHPMSILMTSFAALSGIYNDQSIDESFLISIAKAPYIISAIYHFQNGNDFNINHHEYNDNYCYNFLQIMFDEDPNHNIYADAIEKFCILHMDHEQNASTSTARIVASTQANHISAVSAAIASLWGKLHGGANEALLRMLQDIQDVTKVNDIVKRAKDPNDSFRLMGFGHRVYKEYDPRAKILKSIANTMLNNIRNKAMNEKHLFDIAIKLEKIALDDEYFIKRHLYPNVDFYSGIMMKAIGIPINMFTTIFALARIVGWMSHIKELHEDKEQKLYRPRQWYCGK